MYEEILNAVPKPNGKEKIVRKRQHTQDIIDELIYTFKTYNGQASKAAHIAKTGEFRQDAKNIYDFLKRHIAYKAEPEKDQTSRSFARIIHDRWGDCKHTATVAASLGYNMGYNAIFRFVSYHKGESYGHVYCILQNPKTGQKLVVDPLQAFDYEKPFVKSIDYIAKHNKTKNMTLSRLTGMQHSSHGLAPHHRHTGAHCSHPMHDQHHEAHLLPHNPETLETQVIRGGQEITINSSHDDLSGLDGVGRMTKAQRLAARAARRKKRKERGGLFRMIALAPTRGAFSLLLLVNFHGFATHFQKLIDRHPSQAQAFAKKLGYKWNIFKNQVAKGARKRRIAGDQVAEVNGIGIALATAAAVAAPAIILGVAVLKKMGVMSSSDAANVDQVAAAATGVVNTPGYGEPGPNGQPNYGIPMTAAEKAEIEKEGRASALPGAGGPGSGFQISTPLLVGGGLLLAGVAFMATRSSK